MNPRRRSTPWLLLQLGLGLVWAAVLASRTSSQTTLELTAAQVLTMLLAAGCLPSVALAAWQVRTRRWRAFILSDLLGAGLLVLLACTAYLPLFFFHVVWFLPYALLPRGVLSEIVMRRLEPWL